MIGVLSGSSRWSFIALLGLAVLLAGCAAERLHDQGMDEVAAGHYEQGIALLGQAARQNPEDTSLNMDWLRERQRATEFLLGEGDRQLALGHWDDAQVQYSRVLKIDDANSRAQQGLSAVYAGRHVAALMSEARALFDQGDLNASAAKLALVLTERPKQREALQLMQQIEDKKASESFQAPSLNTLYPGPITLEFRDANIKMALEALSRTTGINFILDHDVPPNAQTTLFVKDSTLEETLDLMLNANHLSKRIINDKTVFIYPDNPNKQNDNQQLVMRSFYLTNTDAKQTMDLIKTFLKTKDMYVDERLNLLIMRDTPEAIKVAEKLISLQDIADPEVMLDISVLEIDSDVLNDLGVQYPQQVNLNVLGAGGASTIALDNVPHIHGSDVQVSGLTANINLERELSEGKILAHPQILARNRQKAKIKIGDRLPIISTTQNTLTNSTSDSVTYVDVGLSVEVQPDIHADDDIAVSLSLEVSSLLSEVQGSNGSVAYQISTRNVDSVLQLKDGETQVLGGLVQDNDTRTDDRLPGLGDIPLLGRLFSNLNKDKQKTEIVLAITPHLIRDLDHPSRDLLQFWAGTESGVTDDVANAWRPSAFAPGGNRAPIPGISPSPTLRGTDPSGL